MPHSLRASLARYRSFFIGIIFIILVFGTLKINQNIANKSVGYFVLQNIEQANEAARLGYIKYEVNDYAKTFGLSWTSSPGVRRIIRSGPDDFDDIGYISMLELIAIAKKGITIDFVEQLHNVAIIISFAILSWIVMKLCRNILAGWIFMVLSLIFKNQILSLVYGSPDSRTFVIFFPCIVITIIFSINWLKTHLSKIWSMAVVFLFGLVIGLMTLIRYSEGMAAIYTILGCIIFLNIKFKQKAKIASIIFLGQFLIVILVPIIFALHRDIKTGEFNGDIRPYLRTTGNHPAWHSIVVGVGKYTNSLGMRYDDITCYNIVRSRYPDAMHPVFNIQGKGYYNALREIYSEYIVDHPFEYAKNMIKSYIELFYFIPYATSAGNLPWSYGYLPVKPGIEPAKRDKGSNVGGLVALRFRYLKLNLAQWCVFILAFFSIVTALRLTFSGKAGNFIYKNIFLTISFYIFLLATQRAIVPQHGLTLLTAFWVFSIISLLYIIFTDTDNIKKVKYDEFDQFLETMINKYKIP